MEQSAPKTMEFITRSRKVLHTSLGWVSEQSPVEVGLVKTGSESGGMQILLLNNA